MKNLLLLMLIFTASFAHASLPKLEGLQSSKLFKKIVQAYTLNPNLLIGADATDRLVIKFEKHHYASDLILTDIQDQVHSALIQNDFPDIDKTLAKISGKMPIENFPSWYDSFSKLAQGDSLLEKIQKNIFVHPYSLDGVSLPFKLSAGKKGFFAKRKRARYAKYYNKIAQDPEGPNLLKYFEAKKGTRLTVTKTFEYRKELPDLRKEFYEKYALTIKAQEKKDRITKLYFEFGFKSKKANPLRIKPLKGASKEFKQKTVQLYNTINALPYKHKQLLYLKKTLKNEYDIELPIKKLSNNKIILFTPSFAHKNLDKILPMIRDFTYIHLFETGDMDYLLHVRKWIKRNRATIQDKAKESGLEINFEHPERRPRVSEVFSEFPKIMMLYPESPWDDNLPLIQDAKGRPVYLKGLMGRLLLRSRDLLQNLASIENISSFVVGASIFATTGQAYAASLGASIIRDLIVTKKYDLNLKDRVPGLIKNGVLAAVFASGFHGGRITEQVMMGGISGATQSYVTGRRMDVGAIVGAAQAALIAQLPRNIAHPTLEGLSNDILWRNALIEVLETTIYKAGHGAIVAIVTNEDVGEGLRDGATYGAIFGSMKVIILGTRYLTTISDEELLLETDYQNDVGSGVYQVDRQLLDDSFFRTGGLLSHNRSFTLTDSLIMSDRRVGDTGVETHELSHRAQIRHFGVAEFYARYGLNFLKNGNGGSNLFENYRYL